MRPVEPTAFNAKPVGYNVQVGNGVRKTDQMPASVTDWLDVRLHSEHALPYHERSQHSL
jgi:hypothetical protein